MQKKVKKVQIFRHLIQLAMLFLLPGLYIMAFSEMKTIYQMVLEGSFNFVQAFPSLIELSIAILSTVILGRFFCGWICVFGAFNDLIHEISKNIFRIDFKINRKADFVLKKMKYAILVLIVVLMWTKGSDVLKGASPWDAFAQITNFPDVLFDFTIGFILLVLITIGAAFIERFFCRYLCPLGAVFSILSKISIFKINKPGEKCGACKACTNVCSMGIPMFEKDSIKGGECINCLKCTEVCPRKNANANIAGENINPALAGSIAIAAFAGIYGINSVSGKLLTEAGLSSPNVALSQSENQSSSRYTDGTYEGSGTGFRGATTTLSVTINNGIISNIETLSSGDTPKFYNRVENTMFNSIISSQSASVDTVSGATFSSRGIIEAVNDALSKAGTSSQVSNSSTASSSTAETEITTPTTDESANSIQQGNTENTAAAVTEQSQSAANTNVSGSSSSNDTQKSSNESKQVKYKDGTYEGSGTGFRGGTTTVSVTVSNGKITNVETISSQDTPRFYNYTIGAVTEEILSSQSTSVDTVSGATYSSLGIIEAVRSALSKAA